MSIACSALACVSTVWLFVGRTAGRNHSSLPECAEHWNSQDVRVGGFGIAAAVE